MRDEVINLEELKLSDRLAVARTVLAADRTLLAWVRTSLTLIGFGFTIYKILSAIQKAGGVTLLRAQTPRNIGIFMILVGVVPLALSMFQYKQGVKRLGGKKNIYVNPSMVAAGAILLLGLMLLAMVVTNIDVF
jgi:putative membrane protein